jgi:hypothetical protein
MFQVLGRGAFGTVRLARNLEDDSLQVRHTELWLYGVSSEDWRRDLNPHRLRS